MNLTSDTLAIGVVGAGAMGSGIAQVAAATGRNVYLFDQREGAAASARDKILAQLDKRIAAGKASAEDRRILETNILVARAIDDMRTCGLVVEAIVEDLAAKRDLFGQLAALVAPDTVLASNTSSLPIGAIAASVPHPQRVVGMHFFNPVPLMKLVEIIPSPETDEAVVTGLMELARQMGQVPVQVRDTPGFLVNFGGRAYTTEALALVHETVATPAQIDAVMRDCCGFRMGPFELMDLTGMDVNFPVTEFVHRSHFYDARLRSTPLHRYLRETGRLGRKTGRGFFDYRGGSPAAQEEQQISVAPADKIVVPGSTPELMRLVSEYQVEVLAHDDGASPILAAPIGEDCSALASRLGLDHRRLVSLDLLANTDKRITIMSAPGADAAIRDRVTAMLAQKRSVTAIADSPGFIAQRICAMVANLGCEMAQIGLAAPTDIDLAMRLGLNYPSGPLEMADAYGVKKMHTIMTQLHQLTGDDRYRPSQWLRRRAQLNLSALSA